jgi:Domain of unknown function (DUF4263)
MVKELHTRSTSRSTAVCNPIVLREGEHVRLVFVPSLVDNEANPKACVDGQFLYERKAKSGRWLPVNTISLATLREGDAFKLTIHAQELLTLVEGLVPLYKFYDLRGVPKGQKTFVEVDKGLAKFISLGEKDLTSLLDSHSDEAATLLLRLITWLATSAGRREAATKLASMAPDQMPEFTALLGIAAIKAALQEWKANSTNSSEEFWQKSFARRTYVLSQLFAYPVVVMGTKAYLGGKQINSKGGKEIDFLFAAESTDALIIIEIKTPQTTLLGSAYRAGVFPLSQDLSGSIAQVLRYRQTLMRTFDSVTADTPRRLTLGEPRCVVVAGHSNQLSEQSMRENFELQRERVQGVTVITYDELFIRLQRLVSLLEEPVS